MTSTTPRPRTPVPAVYDPTAASEADVPLPSAPAVQLALHGCVFQPPLSRRGTGPGLVVVQAPRLSLRPHAKAGLKTPLDPDPVQKWAEEGFGVVGVQLGGETDVQEALGVALAALEQSTAVDGEGRYGVLVYDPSALEAVIAAMATLPSLVCLISHGSAPSFSPVPSIAHIPERIRGDAESLYSHDGENNNGGMHVGVGMGGMLLSNESPRTKLWTYAADSAYFVIPSAGPKAYSPTDAALAHSRSLTFLRRHLGGPHFDLEAIWEEHTYYEFVERSVAKTMGTMVAEPYVNHVPTMMGGVGRAALSEFYRDHFIFRYVAPHHPGRRSNGYLASKVADDPPPASPPWIDLLTISNPEDAELVTVSRTVGADRIVDEFVYKCTHDRVIDWLLPQVPPSGKVLEIPMMAVVNIRGDRLYHEHIWWDQATALKQAGYLPDSVPLASGGTLRLPVAGTESAAMLLDETKGEANGMLGPEYGVHP